jgi:hypothetical protein
MSISKQRMKCYTIVYYYCLLTLIHRMCSKSRQMRRSPIFTRRLQTKKSNILNTNSFESVPSIPTMSMNVNANVLSMRTRSTHKSRVNETLSSLLMQSTTSSSIVATTATSNHKKRSFDCSTSEQELGKRRYKKSKTCMHTFRSSLLSKLYRSMICLLFKFSSNYYSRVFV